MCVFKIEGVTEKFVQFKTQNSCYAMLNKSMNSKELKSSQNVNSFYALYVIYQLLEIKMEFSSCVLNFTFIGTPLLKSLKAPTRL